MTGQHPGHSTVATIIVGPCPEGHVHLGLADAHGNPLAEAVMTVNEALEHAQKVVNAAFAAAFAAIARGPPTDDAPNDAGNIKH